MTDSSGNEPSSSSPSGKRHGLLITSIIGVLVLVAGGTYYFSTIVDGRSENLPPSASGSSTPRFECERPGDGTGVTEPEPTPKQGGLEVPEQGITTSDPDVVDDVSVSFGAVLENTSDLVARKVKVQFAFQDADGNTMGTTDESSVDQKPFSIPYVLPGQQFGLGDGRLLDDAPSVEDLKLQVNVDVEEWWRPDNDKYQFATMTGEVTEASIDVPTAPIVFNVDNSACDVQPNGLAAAVYRDTGGAIVGGCFGLPVYQPLPDGRDPGGTGSTEEFVNDDDNRLDYPSGHLDGAWIPEPGLLSAPIAYELYANVDSTSTMLYPYSPTDD